ncbi:hypothetical protein MRB53_016300 [Persea americana]|uniref:Uncharacterized protein n=1 Tax=Persea americana TaxID=3435 RepID=A0ACC2M2R1_PERAE|nr:hypothetical protein MRB53_016300 [Persea americana]
MRGARPSHFRFPALHQKPKSNPTFEKSHKPMSFTGALALSSLSPFPSLEARILSLGDRFSAIDYLWRDCPLFSGLSFSLQRPFPISIPFSLYSFCQARTRLIVPGNPFPSLALLSPFHMDAIEKEIFVRPRPFRRLISK